MDWVSMAYAMGTGGQGGAGGAGGGLAAFGPLIFMVAIFYFLLIRPQQKKQKEHKNMLANLQRGDTVVTQGGIKGRIMGLTDTEITLEIAEKVRIKVLRGYIGAVLAKGEATKSEPAE
ncbi:MAG: preprotein translocase subunit YajC [Syntrophobacteraceae bacterium]|nr:preprotein translocase subunit YajC [Desulfobacteraceae bacterium]